MFGGGLRLVGGWQAGPWRSAQLGGLLEPHRVIIAYLGIVTRTRGIAVFAALVRHLD